MHFRIARLFHDFSDDVYVYSCKPDFIECKKYTEALLNELSIF